MSIPTILRYPHPVLRRRCKALSAIDGETRQLADGMRAAMLGANGVGLAAPQVGVSIRLLVADVSEQRNQPIALVNPSITNREGEIIWEEGCLSIPGITAMVSRANAVTVSGLTMSGDETSIDAEGLLAICLQHEIDHLDGVLFVDHLSALKRQWLLKKYKKMSKIAKEKQ